VTAVFVVYQRIDKLHSLLHTKLRNVVQRLLVFHYTVTVEYS